MKIFLIFLLQVFLTIVSATVYTGNYSPLPSCNKTKIVNKVPIYELCHYNKIEWSDYVPNTDVSDCNLHGSNGNYLAERSIPSKSFINDGYGYLLFERTHGVYCTLSRFKLKDIDDNKKCPSLTCFPDAPSNTLAFTNCSTNSFYLTNVRALHFTENGTIVWLDVGLYRHKDDIVIVQPPKICFYEPQDVTPNCTEIPEEYANGEDAFYFKNWLVNDLNGPGFQYFYLLNSKTGTVLVFYEATLEFWAFRSILFKPEPHQSLFVYDLPNKHTHQYVVKDGVYNGVVDTEGIYLNSLASNKLLYFPFQILHDPTLVDCPELDLHITYLGSFNERGQSVGFARDNDVIYSLQVQNRALTCFNKKLKLEPEIVQLISIDDHLSHLTSIQLYYDKTDCKKVYFLHNNAIDIELYDFNSLKKNFVLSYVDVKEVEKLYPECRDYYVNYYQEYHGLDKDFREEYHAAHLIAGQNMKPYETQKPVKTYEAPKSPAQVYNPPSMYNSPVNYEHVKNGIPFANPIFYHAQYVPPPTQATTIKKPCYQNHAPSSLVYGQ